MKCETVLFFGLLCAMPIFAMVGCSESGESAKVELTDSGTEKLANVTTIPPGKDAQVVVQEALILAQPGDVIEFAEGKFEFDGTLSVDGISDVTLRGQGHEKTILSFAGFQTGKGGEGLIVKASNFTVEDLTIEDTPGDAMKCQDCTNLTIRSVKTWWTGGPSTENGAYGIYPVLSSNVLIENCVAEGASDAGIYVGQSQNVVIRDCVARQNVAGIEVENCRYVDVYNNLATSNTGGILVFSLPGLTIKNGSDCRVFENRILQNNHENFARQGAMVSTVPSGTGLMVMANDRVEVFDNAFEGNQGAHCLIVSFLSAQRKHEDPEYDPFCQYISIHGNRFVDGGTQAQGEFLEAYVQATGNRVPDIVFDGITEGDLETASELADTMQLSFRNNGEASFVNLDLGSIFAGNQPDFQTEIEPYQQPLQPLPAVHLNDTAN